VIWGLSLPPLNLIPEMNSPSAQFLSDSDILDPSFNEKDFFDEPLELLLELLEFACTALVPSKFWQKVRMLICLNELTDCDCELAAC